MPCHRVVVALLFIAAGITPLAALGAAWGGQGWTTEATATVTGRTAATFSTTPSPSKTPALVAAPGTATQEAVVPQAVEPSPSRTTKAPADQAKPGSKPTGRPTQTGTADPEPTETATAPANPAPTGEPTEGSK